MIVIFLLRLRVVANYQPLLQIITHGTLTKMPFCSFSLCFVCVQSMINRDHHPPLPPLPHSSTTTHPCGSSYHPSNRIKQHKIITKSSCISTLCPFFFYSFPSPSPLLHSTIATNQPFDSVLFSSTHYQHCIHSAEAVEQSITSSSRPFLSSSSLLCFLPPLPFPSKSPTPHRPVRFPPSLPFPFRLRSA